MWSIIDVDPLRLFDADPKTEGIVLMGGIGGKPEEPAASLLRCAQR